MRYIPFFAGIALFAFSIVSLVELHDQEPIELSIEDVIAGKFQDGDYICVTGGWGLYSGVYEFQSQDASDTGEDHTASTGISCLFYPLFSPDNTICKDGSLERSDAIEDEKEYDAFLNQIRDIKVVVKTKKYKNLGDIPIKCSKNSRIKGTIKHGVFSSEIDVEGILQEIFPKAKIKGKDLIQIEQDKIPGEGLRIAGIVFGVIIAVIGVVVIVQMRTRDKAAEALASGKYASYGQPQQPYGQYPGAQGPYPQNPQQGYQSNPQRPYEPYPQSPQPPDEPEQPEDDDGGFPKMP